MATSLEFIMVKDDSSVEGWSAGGPYPLVRYGPDPRFPSAGDSSELREGSGDHKPSRTKEPSLDNGLQNGLPVHTVGMLFLH